MFAPLPAGFFVLPLLQSAAEQAHDKAAASSEYDPSSVRFLSTDPAAYAVGVTDTLQHEKVSMSAVTGALGDEVLLIGERGREAGIFQVTGTASVRALPYAITTADNTLVGEDLYAAGAYLADKPAHVASLLVQDRLRLLLVAAVVAGVIIKTLGW